MNLRKKLKEQIAKDREEAKLARDIERGKITAQEADNGKIVEELLKFFVENKER